MLDDQQSQRRLGSCRHRTHLAASEHFRDGHADARSARSGSKAPARRTRWSVTCDLSRGHRSRGRFRRPVKAEARRPLLCSHMEVAGRPTGRCGDRQGDGRSLRSSNLSHEALRMGNFSEQPEKRQMSVNAARRSPLDRAVTVVVATVPGASVIVVRLVEASTAAVVGSSGIAGTGRENSNFPPSVAEAVVGGVGVAGRPVFGDEGCRRWRARVAPDDRRRRRLWTPPTTTRLQPRQSRANVNVTAGAARALRRKILTRCGRVRNAEPFFECVGFCFDRVVFGFVESALGPEVPADGE